MKTALVTGGTRGIGRAIVEHFLDNGISVISTYNSSSTEADKLIERFGPDKLSFFQFNQGDTSSHNQLLKEIDRPIDILVNNAGLGSKTVERFSNNKREQDELLLKVNSLGPLWLCEDILERMKTTGKGKIINISSVGGGIFHYPGFRLADGMSKAAVTFMTKQLAAENTQNNIDIYAICPGATETDMFKASTLDDLSESEQETFINSLPKNRLINPIEIAKLCLFLTTSEAQIMHGAIIDSSLGLGVNPGLLSN